MSDLAEKAKEKMGAALEKADKKVKNALKVEEKKPYTKIEKDLDYTKIRNETLAILKDEMGSAWEKLSTEDMQVLQDVVEDAAYIKIRMIVDPSLEGEMEIISASLANLAIAKTYPIKKAVWSSLRRVLRFALQAAISAAVSKYS